MAFSMRYLLLASVCGVMAVSLAACDFDSDHEGDDQGTVAYYTDLPDQQSFAGAYLSSRVAQERFDWERAEGFLDRAMSKKPDVDGALQRRLTLLALGAGDMDAAAKSVERFKGEADNTGLTQFIRFIQGMRDNDVKVARVALAAMPMNALSKFAAPLLTAWMDVGVAKESGKKSLPPSALALQGNGVYAYHQILMADYLGVMDAAMADTALARTRETITPMSAEQLGDVFLRHKRFDVAGEFYKLARNGNPNLVGIDARVQAAEAKRADLPAGLRLAPAVAGMPQGAAASLFDMASTFYNDQSYESALVFARMSLALDPDLAEARLLIGSILANHARLDESIAIYNEIPKTDQRYFAVQQKVASLRVDQGQDDAAIQTLQAMVDQTTNVEQKIDYLMQIGDIQRENEDFKDALDSYDAAVDLVGETPKAAHWDLYYARGMTLERLQKWNRAEADLKTALAFQPDHPYIMNYLGYSWADQGINLDDAMKLLLRAVSIVPDDGYVTDSVGWAYYKMGKYDDAVKYLERAVELLPYDMTVNDHLGDAYAKVGRVREAQFQWQRAVNYGEDAKQKAEIEKKLK